MGRVKQRFARSGASAYIDGLIARMGERLRAALETWDVEAVHDARVASRRLKAALDLLRPVIPADAWTDLSRRARRLRRALGPLRDVDVMLDHLRCYRAPGALSPAVSWAVQELENQRRVLREECRSGIGPRQVRRLRLGWWEINDTVRDVDRRAAALIVKALPRVWEEFSTAANRLGDRAPQTAIADDVPDAAGSPDPHAVRIAGKHVRYTLELALAAGFTVRPALLRMFRKLQDELGLWHDFAVLSQGVVELASARQLVLHEPMLYAAALRLAGRFAAASQARLRRFVRRWQEYRHPICQAVGRIADETAGGRPLPAGRSTGKEVPHVTKAVPDAARRSIAREPRPAAAVDPGGQETGRDDGESAPPAEHPPGDDMA